MPRTASLSTKLIRIGAVLLVLALVSIGLTLFVTRQLEGGAAAVNEAGRLRMQTWRLASAVQGQPELAVVENLVQEFDHSLQLLRSGDAARPLFVPWDEAVNADFARVEQLWASQRSKWLARPALPPAESDLSAAAFVTAIDRVVDGIERQLSRLTAVLNLFQLLMMAMAVGSAVVMLYTGYLYVISPLRHLRRGLEKLESGDFTARVEVDTADEFGQVEAGFNRMASNLQFLYSSLESQVEAKTRRIEAQRTRLAALYEVSAFLAGATTLEEMARGFVQRVRAIMKADSAVVRWAEDDQRYLLLASDCFPDAMREEERNLAARTCHCGNVSVASATRVIPIHANTPGKPRACTLAGYATLVSVPIRLQQRLLGELNLFFVSEVTLSTDESELIEALASHLASSLEGLRAAALEREAAVSGERSLLARELHDSIAQSLAFLKIQLQLLRGSLRRGQADQVQAALEEIDTGLAESINDVRELLMNFRIRTNTDAVEPALQATLQKFRQQTGLEAELDISGHGLPLPPDVQVQMLHVVQEALSNVRKHARASRVWLDVTKGRHWRFTVRDNGRGFDAARAAGDNHVGLKIMQERAASIGATVAVSSELDRGTRVVLTLPEHPQRRAGSPSIPAPAVADPVEAQVLA